VVGRAFEIMKLTIDPEFEALIPPLAPEELKQLHMSLCGDGCLSPLIVWQGKGVLVDGHNRYKYLTKNKIPFEVREIEFFDREEVKRFIILNQLGRRNVTPEAGSKLRAEYEESMRMGTTQRASEGGKAKAAAAKSSSDTRQAQDTLSKVAKKTGVSRATVANDVRLMKALDKLGISRNDYAAQKVLDANGKKRTKKSIIAEAFPPKVKPAPTPKKPAPEPPQDDEPLDMQEDEQDAPKVKETATTATPADETDHWFNCLNSLDKITQEQRQELFSILARRWDCKL
jgi:hypothetical protein